VELNKTKVSTWKFKSRVGANPGNLLMNESISSKLYVGNIQISLLFKLLDL
jgi:hypothetical protein